MANTPVFSLSFITMSMTITISKSCKRIFFKNNKKMNFLVFLKNKNKK